MTGPLKWILLLTVGSVQAHDIRRRTVHQVFSPIDDPRLRDDRIVGCSEHQCIVNKRSSTGQDEMGPFWANRGKKDPIYLREPFYVEEPYWVIVGRNDQFQEEPFFISRGKKEAGPSSNLRDRRELPIEVDSPFFAARGRRNQVNN